MVKEEEMTKSEQIGFHKGCISTLVKEREELLKMTKVVEHIMQAHITALEDLGIKLEQPKEKTTKSKIEDLL